MYAGVDVQFHAFVTLAVGGGEWPASRCSFFNLGKELSVLTGYEAELAPNPMSTG
jgi:hypothetical protein